MCETKGRIGIKMESRIRIGIKTMSIHSSTLKGLSHEIDFDNIAKNLKM